MEEVFRKEVLIFKTKMYGNSEAQMTQVNKLEMYHQQTQLSRRMSIRDGGQS